MIRLAGFVLGWMATAATAGLGVILAVAGFTRLDAEGWPLAVAGCALVAVALARALAWLALRRQRQRDLDEAVARGREWDAAQSRRDTEDHR